MNEPSRGPALDAAEIDDIAARLRAGEFLPDDWRDKLFARQKEAELSYAGKEPRGAVLARTMGVPFQVLKRFGSDSDWSNKLIFGDNLQVLKTLLEMKARGEVRNADGSRGVRLCYIDPPFATKREFRGKRGQMAYRDKVAGAEFVEFLRKRLIFIHELLADNGVLYVHLDTNKVHAMKVILDEIFGPHNFRSEIIWKRSSAHSDTKQGRRQFGRIHESILFYTKGSTWPWNPVYTAYDEQHIISSYKHVEEGTKRRYFLGDITGPGGAEKGNPRYEIFGITRYWRFAQPEMERRIASGKVVQPSPGAVPREIRYLDEMEGVSLQDIWTDIVDDDDVEPIDMWMDIKPIGAKAAEREDYPTQKPRELLERIITSSSAEGDLVLDCFAGSGTTAVAAEYLRRRWIAIDCGKLAVYKTQRRLLTMTDGTGRKKRTRQAAAFELCHAGLYDNNLLEQFDFAAFEAFSLDLFGCVQKRQKIAGVAMSGTR